MYVDCVPLGRITMRVGVAGMLHESNTFIAKPTTFEDFSTNILVEGEAVRTKFADAHHEIGGCLAGLAEQKIDAVPLMYAWATPGGMVSADALDRLIAILMKNLDAAGRIDGLLLCPHGAGVSEKHADMDGYWMSLMRQRVGKAVPVIATIDAHCNLSPLMASSADAIIAYRSNPHLDQRDRGVEAASLMARTLRGEVKPTMAVAFPRVAINIERQHTPSAPCKPMYDFADAMLKRPGVLSNSIVLGFPYSDVAEMGSSFIVVTNNDLAGAQKQVDELAAYLVSHRAEFKAVFNSIEGALDEALAVKGPVCLLDMGDNVGGGSAADGTFMAHAIVKRLLASPGKRIRAFIAIYDPAAVQKAVRAGVGARIDLSMGGHTDKLHGPPLDATVTVRSLHEGKYSESEVRHGGLKDFDMGTTAVVETDAGLTVELTSKRSFPTSIRQLTSVGVIPADYQILIAKGVQAPVAAYAPHCTKLIRVNTPGSTSADMSTFTYHHRRKPLYPFEEIA